MTVEESGTEDSEGSIDDCGREVSRHLGSNNMSASLEVLDDLAGESLGVFMSTMLASVLSSRQMETKTHQEH